MVHFWLTLYVLCGMKWFWLDISSDRIIFRCDFLLVSIKSNIKYLSD